MRRFRKILERMALKTTTEPRSICHTDAAAGGDVSAG
jgi:hypothetical protein